MQEFLWPITAHRLDGTIEDTSLTIPDPFALLVVQTGRTQKPLGCPSSSLEGR
ncbi:hypothetical protein [Streptomyces sp. NPDC046988]|uniref:hypothetical protein n=1 Tax=Streptomyces sp. NPDC046988 TaxID=3154922 RepID=UPI003404B173